MPQSLPDRRLHRALIAGVTAAGDVRRGDRSHQRFLRAVEHRLRQLAQVAIQIHAFRFVL